MEYSNGGVCTQILTLAKEYILNGHKVVLVAEGTDFLDRINEIGIIYIDDVKMKSIRFNPLSFYSAYREIKSVIMDYKIDFIHVHTQSALPIVHFLKKKTEVPFVWTNHIDAIPNPQILKWFHRLMKFPIISVSESCKQDLIRRFDIKNKYIRVIPNGIDLNDFRPLSDEEKEQLIQNLGINKENYNICLLSRVAYNKGHDILVKAIKRINENGKINNIHLIIAGSMQEKEWYESEVKGYSQKNNVNIQYVGFQKPRDIFGIADLFVLPSRKEGFGMVCIEALAMHCPVVRSNSPGWNEMVEYTRVVDINDINGLADAIEKAYIEEDQTRKLTYAGYQAVLDVFNSKAMANRTMEVYQDIISKEWPQ